ncbi:MAG TPA: WYL domain-containing protein [Pirellulales bacterium]|nr:WYL domain-containing protein [Pirellulales bacterium]
MPDDPGLVRQWRLLKILGSRRYGISVREMAEEMRVNEKTIRRDLQLFANVGFPLEEAVGDHGRKTWRLRSVGAEPELSFAVDEALALYLGRRFLEPLAGTFLWEATQSAFRKIRACLGKSALEYLESMAANLHQTVIGASDYSKKAELIDQLMIGIEECKATHIEYQSLQATEPVTYEVYPLGLVYHKGSLYLVANSRDHEELRHFKVDRIQEAEVGPFPFQRPAEFDLAEHLAHSFGVFHGDGDICVQVKFLAPVARYVQESKWHESQQLTPQRDGSVIGEFRLSHTEEIKRWLLSFGCNAIVLEPDKLREEVVRESRKLLAHYQSRIGKPVSSKP